MPGGVSDRCRHIAASFTDAGLETYVSADIRRDIWKKLLGNIAMSAVSGTTDLTSAACLNIPELKTTSLRALDEALAVATSHGIVLDRDEALAGMVAISEPGGTGDNKSSLCVDILNQRKTEVDYIYGSVIALGREARAVKPNIRRALKSGVTDREFREMLYQVMHYAGWSIGGPAMNNYKEVLAELENEG